MPILPISSRVLPRHAESVAGLTLMVLLAVPAGAQTPTPPAASLRLPTVYVTAQKEPADAQRLPVSVTVVSGRTIDAAGLSTISEISAVAPNTYFSDLSARKVSNARFRGIGSSPANPAVTTYFDGVPQISANTSSIELMDIEQIEFVRGPQSTLFGRNTLGGLISVSSRRPSLSRWEGSFSAPFANFGARRAHGSVSGPLVDGRLGASAAVVIAERDGFTVNRLTGHDVDFRSSFAGKGQLLWVPTPQWEARLVINGERDRDGDYALNDLAALRENPYTTSRDFEGRTDRDVFSTAVLLRREGAKLVLSSVTGIVDWRTRDVTDLDYGPVPLITRENAEDALQFTQELRVASAPDADLALSEQVSLAWQAGLSVFRQRYDQDAVNTIAPFLIDPAIGVPVRQHSPLASLEDTGFGLWALTTATVREQVDLTAGARIDRENRRGDLNSFFSPAIAPPSPLVGDETFAKISPQVAAAWRPRADRTVYASFAQGYKAGGFNPVGAPGREAYGEEQAWHLEGGLKALLDDGRASATVALFAIDWRDLQLNVPHPFIPGQFYIANVGDARSRGVELEVNARPHEQTRVFGSFGVTRARFKEGSVSSNGPVGENLLPNTPAYTLALGAELSRPLGNGTLYGRGELVAYGAFKYDDANTQEQPAYSLANLSAGLRGRVYFGEVWVRNAFDTRYIPIAFPYPDFARSGFVGEPGAPRTFGIRAGVAF